MVTAERVEELLGRFGGLRLLVVGDVMLDRYWHGQADRLSPEAPVPVVRISREIGVPGGAANVAANVAALGSRVVLAGIRGDDGDGAALAALLSERGIDDQGVMPLSRIPTIVKTRILADRQQVVRVDREAVMVLDAAETGRLHDRVRDLIGQVDGVILEDYGKGTMTQALVDLVLAEASARGIPVGFDPKDNHDLRLAGVTLATPNWREAVSAAEWNGGGRYPDLTDTALEGVAGRLMTQWAPRLLIITLGAQGMYLVSRSGLRRRIATRAREVFDVSGAGDTVIATCLLALAAGASDAEAAELGNHAAGVVVGKLGTATCTPRELANHPRDAEGSAA